MTSLSQLSKLPKYGAGPGLHRVGAMLDALDLTTWLTSTPRIAITGTNGKGSTARFASEILRRAGRRTGLFTSPHLYDVSERFQVDGEPVTDLGPATGRVLAVVDDYEARHPGDRVGGFEVFFVLATLLFADLDVDALVLEAGIGGRFDPVRMARAPLAAVVSVDLDHQELLGPTLLDIALNKVELAAPGGVVLLGETLAPYVAQLTTQASLLGAEAILLPPLADGDVRPSLAGEHQRSNVRIAAELSGRLLGGSVPSEVLGQAVTEAAASTTWPGRLEKIHTDPDVTIDVGHSPAAIEAALTAYAATADPARSLLVVGASANKDVAGLVARLAAAFPVVLATAAHHRGAPAAVVADLARAANPAARVETVARIEDAPARALEIARAEGRSVYVAGGLFLAAEFATALRGGDPAALDFF